MRPLPNPFVRPGGGCARGARSVADGRTGPRRLPADHGPGLSSDATRQVAEELGYVPVVPPSPQRLCPWEYDRVLYRRRNEVERLFRRLKGFRRVFSRFDKLDVIVRRLRPLRADCGGPALVLTGPRADLPVVVGAVFTLAG